LLAGSAGSPVPQLGISSSPANPERVCLGFDHGVFREELVNPLNGPGVQKGA